MEFNEELLEVTMAPVPWPRCTVVTPLPPSDNKLYFNQGAYRSLTTAGRSIKNRISAAVQQELIRSATVFNPNVEHSCRIEVRMPCYPKGKKSKNAFLKKDVQNMQKLVIDAVTSALGIDDSSIFSLMIGKSHLGPEFPSQLRLTITEL